MIAGWLYDETGAAYPALLFAVALFGLVAVANLTFRIVQSSLPPVKDA